MAALAWPEKEVDESSTAGGAVEPSEAQHADAKAAAAHATGRQRGGGVCVYWCVLMSCELMCTDVLCADVLCTDVLCADVLCTDVLRTDVLCAK